MPSKVNELALGDAGKVVDSQKAQRRQVVFRCACHGVSAAAQGSQAWQTGTAAEGALVHLQAMMSWGVLNPSSKLQHIRVVGSGLRENRPDQTTMPLLIRPCRISESRPACVMAGSSVKQLAQKYFGATGADAEERVAGLEQQPRSRRGRHVQLPGTAIVKVTHAVVSVPAADCCTHALRFTVTLASLSTWTHRHEQAGTVQALRA